MIRNFFRFGLINTTCVINLVSILLVANHWFPFQPTLFRAAIPALVILGILSTILMSMTPHSSTFYEKAVNILFVASFVLFFACALSAHANISRFGLERGSDLYDKYSLPALLPAISGGILSILKR